MPTAPTYEDPSRRDPGRPDEEAAARRSQSRTTRASALTGSLNARVKGPFQQTDVSDQGPKPGPHEAS